MKQVDELNGADDSEISKEYCVSIKYQEKSTAI